MSVAGYVLAGGNSTRMGTDKALLLCEGTTLVQRIGLMLRNVTCNVTLVGDPQKYRMLGFPVIPDLRPGFGPLAGMEAALLHSASEWNMIVACDMASLDCGFLQTLASEALELPAEKDCLVPVSPDRRPQPLTAIYRRRCLPVFSEALDRDRTKVTDAVNSLNGVFRQMADAKPFQNVNTPQDWNLYLNGRINDLPQR
jgi:molybdopterin-guanine dinucleotide biosynthesis protein A